MLIGTRLVFPDEAGLWDAELLQISVYRNMNGSMDIMMDTARACRDSGIRYVVHPVGYSLLKPDIFKELTVMSEWADLALILHDERTPDGNRLTGKHEILFRTALDELRSITPVSLENANNTADVKWFWDNFADSVTVDIGHIEAAGINSAEFIKSLTEDIVSKIQYVHMHRNNGLHGGLTDHWPLTRTCNELKGLQELLNRKSGVSVILELNETDEIGESLNILRELRDRLQI